MTRVTKKQENNLTTVGAYALIAAVASMGLMILFVVIATIVCPNEMWDPTYPHMAVASLVSHVFFDAIITNLIICVLSSAVYSYVQNKLLNKKHR